MFKGVSRCLPVFDFCQSPPFGNEGKLSLESEWTSSDVRETPIPKESTGGRSGSSVAPVIPRQKEVRSSGTPLRGVEGQFQVNGFSPRGGRSRRKNKKTLKHKIISSILFNSDFLYSSSYLLRTTPQYDPSLLRKLFIGFSRCTGLGS